MDKTFDAQEAERRIYKAWEDSGAFKAGANASSSETFSIMIPPPNVTGVLHMGHAFNNTLQDILTRWHRMQGHDTLWQPGQDHAGIATQMVVERNLMEAQLPGRREMGREAFTAKVWEWKQQSGGTIIEQLKRLGASCDWSRNAFTMSGAPNAPEGEEGNFHDAVIKVFVKMYEDGLIYRGKRLVNWDPHFETAISDLEVENIEVDGHMWHFKYPLADGVTYEYVEKDEDGNETLRETRDYISIATTRPETMLGDGAVAVHPSDERYAPIVGKLCEIPVGPKEHRRLIPIITDEYPDPEFGSGAVKITGAHDFNDYAVAKRGNIPMYRLMDTKGDMRSDGAPYAEAAAIAMAVAKGEKTLTEAETDTINLIPDDLRGLPREAARKQVVEQITAEGLAVMTTSDDPRLGRMGGSSSEDEGSPIMVPLVEAKKIMAPYGDRSKVVIEPMLTDQWFVDTAKIVGPALDAVRDGTTEILPEQHKKVYFNWLENIEPWCISRQLWWGHQIPVWHVPRSIFEEARQHVIEGATKGNSELAPLLSTLTSTIDLVSSEVTQHSEFSYCASSQKEADQLIQDRHRFEPKFFDTEEEALSWWSDNEWSGPMPVYRDPDVLDTWFSSGLWPIGTLGWPEDTEELKKYFPTSVLITGFDIIFFWVARMMMMQYATVGDRPFDTVYVHALVRDEKGKKMSKSLGNVLDPLELVDEYGADAVRFTLTSMAAMGRDLKLSTQRIQGYRNFTTKLWNAARFAEMNGVFSVERTDAIPTQYRRDTDVGHSVNKWIVGEVAKTRIALDEALSAFRFNDAANTLYAFTYTYCDWYLEFSKPLMSGDFAEETRATMAWALDQLLIMLHPIMPFITEELWSLSAPARAKMCVHADWPTYGAEIIDEKATSELNWVRDLIEKTRSVRGEMNVPKKEKVTLLQLSLDPLQDAIWAANETLILADREAGIAGRETASEAPKGSATIAVEGGTFALPLAGLIDANAEKARLEKSVGKLQKEVGGLENRLNNPKFRENASADVIEETEENARARREELTRLETALARLEELA